jgi:predicted nucleotidyltransferase
MDLATDPILARFRAALAERFAGQIKRAVLFGSRARGDEHEGSDYDIAVVFNDGLNPWAEMTRLADIGIDILDDTGAMVNVIPFPADGLEDRTILTHEIRKDGRDIL